MKIFLECTFTRTSSSHTGIQRVVRNIINNLSFIQETNTHFQAVYFEGPKWFPTQHIDFPKPQIDKLEWHAYFVELLKAPTLLLLTLIPFKDLRAWLHSIYLKIQCLLRGQFEEVTDPRQPILFKKGDVLVLLDSSWHNLDWFLIDELRAKGVIIVTIFYDLIPVTNPEYCDIKLKNIFIRWAKNAVRKSDFAISISKTTTNELKIFAAKEKGIIKSYDYFYLGSNLDGADNMAPIRQNILAIFTSKAPVFVTVGTIEPRKNHAIILKGFTEFIQKAQTAKLLIIGRQGWMVENFVSQMQANKYFGTQIIWIQDATDSELDFIYCQSRALIFASFVEGFGLPLIEARQRGLPIVASDIPVFREIADEFVEFFNVNDSADLCRSLQNCPIGRKPRNWIDWQEATERLCGRIQEIVGNEKANKQA